MQQRDDDVFDEEFLQRLEYLRMVSRKIAAGKFRARRETETVGSGIDFAEHRQYTPGDDVRNIDWRLYRRSENLFVKRYEEERDLHIHFLVDTSPSMHLGEPSKWSVARKIAAALGYIGLCNLDRVGVIPFSSDVDDRLAPARGRARIFDIFDVLMDCEPGEETAMETAFQTFVREHSRPGLAVVVSDFYDPAGFERGLDVLRHHRFEPLVVQVYDEREFSVSVRGEVELVDCETGSTRRATVGAGVGRRLRRAFEQFSDELESWCTRRGILYFRTPVQRSFEELVLEVFRAGGFLE